ncbi:dnaJ homolog subfamily C member 4 isoform 2-T2 [Spinachia spinachia]
MQLAHRIPSAFKVKPAGPLSGTLRRFPSCSWRLSCVFVGVAFGAAKVGCVCCPGATHTDVNYYDLLGVQSNASLEEIKNAFFHKSKKLHPDSDPSNPELHSLFVELNEAYRVLSKDLSRKEYDFKLRRPYSGGQAFSSTSSHTSYRASTEPQPNFRYREQFRHSEAQEMTAEESQRRKRRNFHLVGYCFVTMVLGIGAHVVFFRKLGEVHNSFMDEKDRVITEIYNESKERAKANGFKKQTEILRQKHATFLEKYNIRKDGGDK